jgi:hypothetical protein
MALMAAPAGNTWDFQSGNQPLRRDDACDVSVDGVPGEADRDVASNVSTKAQRQRRRALIFPREHGAWGLLLVPMVTGASIAFHQVWAPHVSPPGVPHVSPPLRDMGIALPGLVPFLLLLTAALALFWLRTPVESLLGTSPMRAQTNDERRAVVVVIAALGAIAALALGALLWAGRNPDLWLIGAAAAAAFIVQALLRRLGRSLGAPFLARSWREKWESKLSTQSIRMFSEIVGTIGLTASAPAAYYVMTGKFGGTAWMLWLANLIFAGNQIHYVQVRIHTARAEGISAKFARGWAFALGQFVMALVLLLACLRGLMPWLALIAFAPILFRGWFYFFQKPAPLVVRRLGWSELGQAVGFCALFTASFALSLQGPPHSTFPDNSSPEQVIGRSRDPSPRIVPVIMKPTSQFPAE